MDSPSFFKIMLGEFNQFQIPQPFVIKFNDKLRKKMLLKTSTGKKWVVHLKKTHLESYFHGKGWKLFIQENFIEIGDFLVFTLVGDSILYSKVYDKSCCEKEKPKGIRNVDPCIFYKRKRKHEEIRPNCRTSEYGKGRVLPGKLIADESNPEKSRHMMNIVKTEPPEAYVHGIEQAPGVIAKVGPINRMCLGKQAEIVPSRRRQLVSKRERNDSISAFLFKSDYPFSVLWLSRTYVESGYLQLPTHFVETSFPKKIKKDAWIVGTNGKTWCVKYSFKTSKAYICGGWDAVVAGNNLREGSICAFELIDAEDIKLRLSVLN